MPSGGGNLEVHLPICSQLLASGRGGHAIFYEDGSVVSENPIHVMGNLQRQKNDAKNLLRVKKEVDIILFWWMEG